MKNKFILLLLSIFLFGLNLGALGSSDKLLYALPFTWLFCTLMMIIS